MSLRDHRATLADEANTRLSLPQESAYAGSRKQVRSWSKSLRPEGSQRDDKKHFSIWYFIAVAVIVLRLESNALAPPTSTCVFRHGRATLPSKRRRGLSFAEASSLSSIIPEHGGKVL